MTHLARTSSPTRTGALDQALLDALVHARVAGNRQAARDAETGRRYLTLGMDRIARRYLTWATSPQLDVAAHT